MREAEYPFVIIDIWDSSVSCLLIFLAHFSTGGSCLFLTGMWGFLHILATNPFSTVYIIAVCSVSVVTSFHLFMEFLVMHRSLMFFKFK